MVIFGTFLRSGGSASEVGMSVGEKCQQYFENGGSVPLQEEERQFQTTFQFSFLLLLLLCWRNRNETSDRGSTEKK
jgi:hypothetical protein